MVKALFDTVIVIDYLNGVGKSRAELGRYEDRAISIVSWMEAMAGAPPQEEQATRDFLNSFLIIPIEQEIAARAVTLRRERRLKLPDAIVWATALVHGRLLVTRDADFPRNDPGVRVPYIL